MTSNRLVRYSVTFDVVTPESAAEGDFAETGFAVKDRVLLWSESETLVEAAAELVADRLGHVEASSSGPLDASDWFTQADGDVDYSTGAERRESVHFDGLTDDEMGAIASILVARGLLPSSHLRRA